MAKHINLIFREPPSPIQQTGDIQAKIRQEQSIFGTQYLPLMWGKVLQRTGMQTVDVELMHGLKLRDVPVASRRWVAPATKSDEEQACGEVDLPPSNAKVLVAFVNGVIENAVVLPVSGFDVLVPEQKKVLLKSGQQHKIISVDEYGWVYEYNKETGTQTYKSPDRDVQFSVTVSLQSNTVQLTYKFSNSSSDVTTITISGGGVTIQDRNTNKIELTSNGAKITDKHGNVIETTTTSVKINDNFEVLR